GARTARTAAVQGGGPLVRHARYFISQRANGHLTLMLFRQILARIERLEIRFKGCQISSEQCSSHDASLGEATLQIVELQLLGAGRWRAALARKEARPWNNLNRPGFSGALVT